jgi:hypothetical protein
MAASRKFTVATGFLCDKGSVLGERIKGTPYVFCFNIGEKWKYFSVYCSRLPKERRFLEGSHDLLDSPSGMNDMQMMLNVEHQRKKTDSVKRYTLR